MTRKQFLLRIKIVIGIYLLAFLLGIALRLTDLSEGNVYYEMYKDLISFIIALPAAYLGYCIQQRVSFLQFLRAAWSNLVKAMNNAILYTRNEEPEKKEYFEMLSSLRVAIDEIRGIYKNVGERPGEHGLYPVSPILDIYQKVEKLNSFGKLPQDEVQRRKDIGESFFDIWKSVRGKILSELDRPDATEADTSRNLPDRW